MKLNIFTSTISDGIMSNDKKFFPKLDKKDIDAVYKLNIDRFLTKYNLSSENVIIMNDSNTKKSSSVVVNNNNKYKDRILILKEQTKNTPILVECDDEPVIVASAKDDNDKQVAVISKASIENLNNNLIYDMTEALIKETNKPTFEMTFYIGPCPAKENFYLDKNIELNDAIFSKAVEKIKGKKHLDLRYAIFNQLYLEIVDPNQIYFDSNDTTTSNKYFSKFGKKLGKHVTCVVFTDEEV